MITRIRFLLGPIPSILLRAGLFAVLLASACAPQPSVTVAVEPSATPLVEVPSPTLESISTETPEPNALPIATSRGPNLEATDPTTVNLASGQIQFVEFFRFT